MAVGVVGAHRHEGDASAGGREELRIRVPAAVVRDLEDVGSEVGAVAS
jgi:hypothetical protein